MCRYSIASILVGFERLSHLVIAAPGHLKENAVSQTILGQKGLIDVDHVASMIRALAPATIDVDNLDCRANAARAIWLAKTEAAKSGGSIVSAEQIWMLIFNWATDERLAITRASQ